MKLNTVEVNRSEPLIKINEYSRFFKVCGTLGIDETGRETHRVSRQ